MKQYLSDTDYLDKKILHLPASLIRDIADMVPVCILSVYRAYFSLRNQKQIPTVLA